MGNRIGDRPLARWSRDPERRPPEPKPPAFFAGNAVANSEFSVNRDERRDRWERFVHDKKAAVLEVADRVGQRLIEQSGETPHSELPLDGRKYDIEIKPPDDSGKPPLIVVNGAGCNQDRALALGNMVAKKFGRDATLVYNATANDQYETWRGRLGAFLSEGEDIQQCIDDHHDRGVNPAVNTLRDEVLDRMRNGQGADLVAHSQGNIITARALREARDIRYDELCEVHPATEAQEILEQEFAKIKVVNLNGPTKKSDYPDELVHYEHAESRRDSVPNLLGENSDKFRDKYFDLRAETIRYDLAMHPIAHSPGLALALHGHKLKKFLDE